MPELCRRCPIRYGIPFGIVTRGGGLRVSYASAAGGRHRRIGILARVHVD